MRSEREDAMMIHRYGRSSRMESMDQETRKRITRELRKVDANFECLAIDAARVVRSRRQRLFWTNFYVQYYNAEYEVEERGVRQILEDDYTVRWPQQNADNIYFYIYDQNHSLSSRRIRKASGGVYIHIGPLPSGHRREAG